LKRTKNDCTKDLNQFRLMW